MSTIKSRPLHIAMYPWFAFGHLTSFLHLANKLAESGNKISIFLPAKTHPKLASHNHHPNLMTIIPITVPTIPGLPAGAETTNDVPASAWSRLMDAMDLTQTTIDSYLYHLKPDLVFYDFTLWLPDLARKHQAKSVCYITSYMVNPAYGCPLIRNLPANHRFTEAELLQPPPDFPSPLIRLLPSEARELAFLCTVELGGGIPILERLTVAWMKGDAIAVKSCREMEGAYCDIVEQAFRKPVLLTGPVVAKPSGTTALDQQFDGWLKSFSQASVVYCALGSECVLEMAQFQELVLGLELTGMHIQLHI